jgi:hypothetical protein
VTDILPTVRRRQTGPTPVRHIRPHQSAEAVAAYLIDRPVKPSLAGDACLRTHDRVRIAGSDIVHRLDVRAKTLYTTGCGERITKTAGVLTAAAVDCRHHGCGVTA